MPHSYFKWKLKITFGWDRLRVDGRIEEKDLDKSGGTLLSLEISGVTVINGWFLFLLSQLDGGFWSHTECERRQKRKGSVRFGLDRESNFTLE